MKEQEYIELFTARWPKTHESPEPTPETIRLCDQAIREHPNSAKLWIFRGCLLQLADFETGYSLKECEVSFLAAIKAEPRNPDAYQELGHFFNAVMDNPRKAKQYFRKAFLLCRAKAQ